MRKIKDTVLYKIFELKRRIDEIAKADLEAAGLTRESFVSLRLIHENRGITQAELAELEHRDRNVIGRTAERLEKLGYIRREKDTDDGRCLHLYMTENGEDLMPICWGAMMHIVEKLTEALNDEEKAALEKILAKMTV